MEIAIKANHLSKEYYKGYKGFSPDTLGGGVLKFIRGKALKGKKFHALQDVSFELEHGNILGIIGSNGAGKSTLLKILSRITPPTSGRVEMTGRVSSLLEVGTGFHPQLTGKENVFLNGALLGMTKKEITSRMEQIVNFAEVEEFMDVPVKQFSSGMKVRLAFSVAAHLQAEILIVDEVLAVGDAAFQAKCLGKMNEVSKSGKTVLLVSHNMSAIKNLCSHAIYLKGGMKEMEGRPDEVIKAYLNANLSEEPILQGEALLRNAEHVNSYAKQTFILNRIALCSGAGEYRKEFLSDEEINIELGFEIFRNIKDLQVIVTLVDEDNRAIMSSQLNTKNASEITAPGAYSAFCRIPANLLGQNQYFVSVSIVNPSIEHLIITKALSFNVTFRKEDSIYIGKLAQAWIRPELDWGMKKKANADILRVA